MPDKDHLYNAVWNNWHGYGLILKDGNGRIQVIKKLDEKGNDPEEIWTLLEANKDIERVLHVRYSTRGGTSEQNTQPFNAYNSSKRNVWFCHNGTLSSYGTYGTEGKSDTLEFCEKILQPGLLRWEGEHGRGDYTDAEFWKLILEKHWTYNSKGLLIADDLPVMRFGSGWSEYKQDDENAPKIWISTTEYITRVSRGPEHNRREEARKAKEAEDRKNAPFLHSSNTGGNTGGNTTSTSPLKVWNGANTSKDPRILKAVTDVVDRWDLDDPKDVAKFSALTYDEWCSWIANEGEFTAGALIQHMAEVIKKQSVHIAFLQKTKDKAQARLQQIAKEDKNGRIAEAA